MQQRKFMSHKSKSLIPSDLLYFFFFSETCYRWTNRQTYGERFSFMIVDQRRTFLFPFAIGESQIHYISIATFGDLWFRSKVLNQTTKLQGEDDQWSVDFCCDRQNGERKVEREGGLGRCAGNITLLLSICSRSTNFATHFVVWLVYFAFSDLKSAYIQ